MRETEGETGIYTAEGGGKTASVMGSERRWTVDSRKKAGNVGTERERSTRVD